MSIEEGRSNRGRLLFDWYASAIEDELKRERGQHPGGARPGGECRIQLRTASGWRPFADGAPFSVADQYEKHYASFSKHDGAVAS
jgi:hypothetical protein